MTIYVAPLNEGTPVWRPVEAEHLGDDVFRIVSEAADDEVWQFESGTIVRYAEQTFSDGKRALVALERF
jgi:hypothetical protein